MVGSKPLYVALAQRKEDRKAKLQVNIFLHVLGFIQLALLYAFSQCRMSGESIITKVHIAPYVASYSYFTC